MKRRRHTRLLASTVAAAAFAVAALPSLAAHAAERRITFTAGERGAALIHFAPELGRVVGEVLTRAGADVDEVSGRVDELDGERVRLTVSARGQRVVEEGALEEIDALARRLGERLAQGTTPSVRDDKRLTASRAAALLPPSKTELAKAQPSSKTTSTPDTKSDGKPDVKSDGKPDAKPDAKAEAKPDTKSATPVAAVTPVSTSAGVVPASAKETSPSTSAASPPASTAAAATPPNAVGSTTTTTTPSPPATTPTTNDAPARNAHDEDVPVRSGDPYQAQGFVPRRVVVHQVAEIPTAYGAGYSATHALFSYLRTRMRLQVVPGGVGLAPLHIVVDEGMRSGARAVVMARLLSVETLGAAGALRCRLELVVVRDGRMVLRRIIDAIPSDPNVSRARAQDPVYVAVAQALDSLTAELDGVLAPIR